MEIVDKTLSPSPLKWEDKHFYEVLCQVVKGKLVIYRITDGGPPPPP